MSKLLQMGVACDTPLGVEFATLEAKGKGVLIVERIVEAFAKARDWKPEECELLVITDANTGRQMWSHDGEHALPDLTCDHCLTNRARTGPFPDVEGDYSYGGLHYCQDCFDGLSADAHAAANDEPSTNRATREGSDS